MLEKFAQRVKAGAKLLDERMPDWRDKIDVRRLDMHEANDCILGQIGAALPVPDHRFYTPPYLTAGRHFGILGQQMLIDLGFETDQIGRAHV